MATKPTNSDTPPDVAAFEEWAKRKPWYDLALTVRTRGCTYEGLNTEHAWRGWQARGRSKPAPDPELDVLRTANHVLRKHLAWALEEVPRWIRHLRNCCKVGCGEPHADNCPLMAAREALDPPAPEPAEAKPKATVKVDPCPGGPFVLLVCDDGMTIRWATVAPDDEAWFTARLTGE